MPILKIVDNLTMNKCENEEEDLGEKYKWCYEDDKNAVCGCEQPCAPPSPFADPSSEEEEEEYDAEYRDEFNNKIMQSEIDAMYDKIREAEENKDEWLRRMDAWNDERMELLRENKVLQELRDIHVKELEGCDLKQKIIDQSCYIDKLEERWQGVKMENERLEDNNKKGGEKLQKVREELNKAMKEEKERSAIRMERIELQREEIKKFEVMLEQAQEDWEEENKELKEEVSVLNEDKLQQYSEYKFEADRADRLEEENKKLKEKHKKYENWLVGENKKLDEENDRLRERMIDNIRYVNKIDELKEENKKLQERIELDRKCSKLPNYLKN